MENGVYKNDNATYYIKDDLVVMYLNGGWFKTNSNFLAGAKRTGDLPDAFTKPGVDFAAEREKLKSW